MKLQLRKLTYSNGKEIYRIYRRVLYIFYTPLILDMIKIKESIVKDGSISYKGSIIFDYCDFKSLDSATNAINNLKKKPEKLFSVIHYRDFRDLSLLYTRPELIDTDLNITCYKSIMDIDVYKVKNKVIKSEVIPV